MTSDSDGAPDAPDAPSVFELATSAAFDAFRAEAAELETHFTQGLVGVLATGLEAHGAALERLIELRPEPVEESAGESKEAGGSEESGESGDAPAEAKEASTAGEGPAEEGPAEEGPAEEGVAEEGVAEEGVDGEGADPERGDGEGADGEGDEDVETSAEADRGLVARRRAEEEAVLTALGEYRAVVMSEVLEAVLQHLEHGPTQALGESFDRTAAATLAACEALPKEFAAPWTTDALQPRPSDSWHRRFGKALARVVSGARKAGRTRKVPLRAVVVRHVIEDTVPREAEARVASMTEWAEWSRRLEVALVDWVQAALGSLVQAEGPDGDVPDSTPLEVVTEAGAVLHRTLEELCSGTPTLHGPAAAAGRLDRSAAVLTADVAVAGSFVYSPSVPEHARIRADEVERASARLAPLDEGLAERIRMYVAVMGMLSGLRQIRERLLEAFREKCLPGISRLLELSDEFEALAREVENAPDPARGLEVVHPRLEAALRELDGIVLPLAEIEPVVETRSMSLVESMLSVVRQMPESLLLNSAEARARGGVRRVERRAIALQELARQSFDALRMERIRAAAAGLAHVGERLHDQIDALPQVVSYANEQAEEEVAAGGEDAADRARTLLAVAIRNVGESIRAGLHDAEVALSEIDTTLRQEARDGAAMLLDRVRAGLMQAQLLRARSRVTAARAWLTERWGPYLTRAVGTARSVVSRLTRLASRGIQRGSAIVSGHAVEQSDSVRALRVLADPDGVTEHLPLVYQRLFTFEPLSDPALLAGRDAELEMALGRWERWKQEDAVPVIVRGRQGGGVSSFLNVLSTRIQQRGEDVFRIELGERITDEKSLSRRLARRLELDPCETLDDVASAVFATHETPGVVVIDNLEHLYLRVPGGTDLVERLLTLMAETEPRIFWIGGIAASAWQLVATAEPTAVSQIEVLDLPPLTPESLREAITVRHRRSGLPVRFEEPSEGRAMLRRKLRRARTAEARRELLVTDFFEQLQRTSGGNVRLALFLALQASDFGTGDGLLMHPPVRPDFSVLESLTLTQNFTLKAFLEHRTLTLTEHDRIFRLPRHESYQIFESLNNRHLIRTVSTPYDRGDERSEVEDERRYRVQPLLVGAVIGHLAARNIVH